MSERYWITGVQLGCLISGKKRASQRIVFEIVKSQFIGTKEDLQELLKAKKQAGEAGMAERSNAPDLKQRNVCLKGETQKTVSNLEAIGRNAGSNPVPRNKAKKQVGEKETV